MSAILNASYVMTTDLEPVAKVTLPRLTLLTDIITTSPRTNATIVLQHHHTK